jgi:formyltetrahydrofolate deformylase
VATEPTVGQEFVITLSCPDKPGIVYAVSSFLVQHSANILASQQYGDGQTGRFFMRVQFAVPPPGRSQQDLERGFSWVAEAYGMSWRMFGAVARARTLIMVSRLSHCLNDLLFRWRAGSLPIEIAGVVSNHPDFRELTASYRVPYHHVPVTSQDREDAEATLLTLVGDLNVELVVLARYMQILSEEVCKRLEGQVINIHHSFLPSFKGARPYHQAHARGVKLIGATAHYVTPDLDEGPIIEQDVARVDHGLPAERLAEVGRDIEAQVLARAVRWHAEHRVLLNGTRTVVFH